MRFTQSKHVLRWRIFDRTYYEGHGLMTHHAKYLAIGKPKPNSNSPLEGTSPLTTTRLRYFHISTSDDADQSPRKQACAMLFLAVSESCPSSAVN